MECVVCLSPKAQAKCGICQSDICKKCATTLESDSFSFLGEIPKDLNHYFYCGPCFVENVEPPLKAYRETMKKARQVSIFYKKQSKESRWFKRNEKPIKVECADRDESLLRLAFIAASTNFHLVVDVELTAEKIQNGGYQTSRWTAFGIPVLGTP